MGSSVSVSLADEQEPAPEEFSTTRVTNRGAARQIKYVIRGGLTESQISFCWNKIHSRTPAGREKVVQILKSLIDEYPTLLVESLELAFQTYARAPNASLDSAKIKKELQGQLQSVYAQIKKSHAALNQTQSLKLANELAESLKIAKEIGPDEFATRFQEELGPALAERFMAGQFSDSLLSDLSSQFYNRLRRD